MRWTAEAAAAARKAAEAVGTAQIVTEARKAAEGERKAAEAIEARKVAEAAEARKTTEEAEAALRAAEDAAAALEAAVVALKTAAAALRRRRSRWPRRKRVAKTVEAVEARRAADMAGVAVAGVGSGPRTQARAQFVRAQEQSSAWALTAFGLDFEGLTVGEILPRSQNGNAE